MCGANLAFFTGTDGQALCRCQFSCAKRKASRMSPEPLSERRTVNTDLTDKPDWAKSARELRREQKVERQSKTPRHRRTLWPWGIVAVLTLALAGVILIPASAPTAITTAPPLHQETVLLHPADLTVIKRQEYARTLPVSGTLSPARRVEIVSRTTGMVEAVNAGLGDRVARGYLLAQIQNDALEAQLRQSRASVVASQAEADLASAQAERVRQLSDRGLAATAVMESQTSRQGVQAANLEMQKAAVAAAEIALSDTHVLAPFDGIVAHSDITPGQTVSSGTIIFELVDLSSMLAEIDIPVARTVALQTGQQVRLEVQGLPGQKFTGRIEGIAPITGKDSRNSRISVRVKNPAGILRGGMFVSGEIVLTADDAAIAIPETALRDDAAGRFALKLSGEPGGDRLIRQPVKTGPDALAGGLIAIASGLEEADRIISGRLPELREGMAVRVAEPD